MRSLVFFILVALLTSCAGSSSNNDHNGHSPNSTSRNSSTQETTVQKHDAIGHGGSDHRSMTSSPGAASALFELQFLDTMIVHHKGAVEMAVLAESRAQRAEVKELADNIVNDQEREIARISEWRERWFEGKPLAVNMDFPGMTHSMKGWI